MRGDGFVCLGRAGSRLAGLAPGSALDQQAITRKEKAQIDEYCDSSLLGSRKKKPPGSAHPLLAWDERNAGGAMSEIVCSDICFYNLFSEIIFETLRFSKGHRA